MINQWMGFFLLTVLLLFLIPMWSNVLSYMVSKGFYRAQKEHVKEIMKEDFFNGKENE